MPAVGQEFGRNKPHYTTFDFKVASSDHFSLYHYLKNDSLVHRFLSTAERWYDYEQVLFRDTFKTRNPIILYANHADFQQTTAISGSIGVGTGGVTESLRNRIAMPVMELNAQTNHVLGHELVHAFQYAMFRKSSDSLRLSDIQRIPLWMVEGLAEYLSVGNRDSHTAMWMRDAVREDDFPTLREMTRDMKYFPYRYGQAFWAFMTGVFGDTVVYPLFLNTARYGYEEAIKQVTGLDEKTFSSVWKKNMVDHYSKYRPPLHADRLAGRRLIDNSRTGGMDIAPSLSPNGAYVAFLSQKNFLTIDLLLADARTGKILKTLASTARSGHIDDFSYIESSGTWSPHSERFAFPVFSEGRMKLNIVNLDRNGRVTTLAIPGVSYFSNPSWSPDGRYIVVSGMAQGQSDLYLFDPATSEVIQLTDDWYSDIQPQWSNDGTQIIFVSDRPASGRFYSERSLQICFFDLEDKQIRVLDIFHGAENFNPAFAPDNQSFYFLSNRDGFRNLYNYDLTTGSIEQLTDYFTGISGITAYSPAISVSRQDGNVAYTYFSGGKYALYLAAPEDFQRQSVQADEVDMRPGTLPPETRVLDRVNAALADLRLASDVSSKVEHAPYQPTLQLEYLGNEASIGVTTGGGFGSRTGMAGAVNALFGDMLGYHKLYSVLSLNGQVYDFGGLGAYLNQGRRVNWGVSVSHIPYRSAYMGVIPDSVVTRTDTLYTDNVVLDVARTFESNASVFSYLILNTKQRLEAGVGYSRYAMRIDRYQTHYYFGLPIQQEHDKLDPPDGYNVGNAYAAYVFDNSYFGMTSPMRGKRCRFEVEQSFDALNYYTLLGDYRQYIFFNPTTLAFRVMYAGRHGTDAESRLLYPLSFAYPTFTRGNSLDNLEGYADSETGSFSINQIFGSRMAVGNVEFRIPFSGPKRYALIPSNLFFTQLALFADVGVAWDSQSRPVLNAETKTVDLRTPFVTAGLSARMNLFNAVILEAYYAFPWRGDHFGRGVFGLNFVPGW